MSFYRPAYGKPLEVLDDDGISTPTTNHSLVLPFGRCTNRHSVEMNGEPFLFPQGSNSHYSGAVASSPSSSKRPSGVSEETDIKPSTIQNTNAGRQTKTASLPLSAGITRVRSPGQRRAHRFIPGRTRDTPVVSDVGTASHSDDGGVQPAQGSRLSFAVVSSSTEAPTALRPSSSTCINTTSSTPHLSSTSHFRAPTAPRNPNGAPQRVVEGRVTHSGRPSNSGVEPPSQPSGLRYNRSHVGSSSAVIEPQSSLEVLGERIGSSSASFHGSRSEVKSPSERLGSLTDTRDRARAGSPPLGPSVPLFTATAAVLKPRPPSAMAQRAARKPVNIPSSPQPRVVAPPWGPLPGRRRRPGAKNRKAKEKETSREHGGVLMRRTFMGVTKVLFEDGRVEEVKWDTLDPKVAGLPPALAKSTQEVEEEHTPGVSQTLVMPDTEETEHSPKKVAEANTPLGVGKHMVPDLSEHSSDFTEPTLLSSASDTDCDNEEQKHLDLSDGSKPFSQNASSPRAPCRKPARLKNSVAAQLRGFTTYPPLLGSAELESGEPPEKGVVFNPFGKHGSPTDTGEINSAVTFRGGKGILKIPSGEVSLTKILDTTVQIDDNVVIDEDPANATLRPLPSKSQDLDLKNAALPQTTTSGVTRCKSTTFVLDDTLESVSEESHQATAAEQPMSPFWQGPVLHKFAKVVRSSGKADDMDFSDNSRTDGLLAEGSTFITDAGESEAGFSTKTPKIEMDWEEQLEELRHRTIEGAHSLLTIPLPALSTDGEMNLEDIQLCGVPIHELFKRLFEREKGAMRSQLSGLDLTRFMRYSLSANEMVAVFFWFVVVHCRRVYMERLLIGRFTRLTSLYQELFPRGVKESIPDLMTLRQLVVELHHASRRWNRKKTKRFAWSSNSSVVREEEFSPQHMQQLNLHLQKGNYATILSMPRVYRGGTLPPLDVIESVSHGLNLLACAMMEHEDLVRYEELCFHRLAILFGTIFTEVGSEEKDVILPSYGFIVVRLTNYALHYTFPNDANAGLFHADFRADMYRIFQFWCSGLQVTHVAVKGWPLPLAQDFLQEESASEEKRQEVMDHYERGYQQGIGLRRDEEAPGSSYTALQNFQFGCLEGISHTGQQTPSLDQDVSDSHRVLPQDFVARRSSSTSVLSECTRSGVGGSGSSQVSGPHASRIQRKISVAGGSKSLGDNSISPSAMLFNEQLAPRIQRGSVSQFVSVNGIREEMHSFVAPPDARRNSLARRTTSVAKGPGSEKLAKPLGDNTFEDVDVECANAEFRLLNFYHRYVRHAQALQSESEERVNETYKVLKEEAKVRFRKLQLAQRNAARGFTSTSMGNLVSGISGPSKHPGNATAMFNNSLNAAPNRATLNMTVEGRGEEITTDGSEDAVPFSQETTGAFFGTARNTETVSGLSGLPPLLDQGKYPVSPFLAGKKMGKFWGSSPGPSPTTTMESVEGDTGIFSSTGSPSRTADARGVGGTMFPPIGPPDSEVKPHLAYIHIFDDDGPLSGNDNHLFNLHRKSFFSTFTTNNSIGAEVPTFWYGNEAMDGNMSTGVPLLPVVNPIQRQFTNSLSLGTTNVPASGNQAKSCNIKPNKTPRVGPSPRGQGGSAPATMKPSVKPNLINSPCVASPSSNLSSGSTVHPPMVTPSALRGQLNLANYHKEPGAGANGVGGGKDAAPVNAASLTRLFLGKLHRQVQNRKVEKMREHYHTEKECKVKVQSFLKMAKKATAKVRQQPIEGSNSADPYPVSRLLQGGPHDASLISSQPLRTAPDDECAHFFRAINPIREARIPFPEESVNSVNRPVRSGVVPAGSNGMEGDLLALGGGEERSPAIDGLAALSSRKRLFRRQLLPSSSPLMTYYSATVLQLEVVQRPVGQSSPMQDSLVLTPSPALSDLPSFASKDPLLASKAHGFNTSTGTNGSEATRPIGANRSMASSQTKTPSRTRPQTGPSTDVKKKFKGVGRAVVNKTHLLVVPREDGLHRPVLFHPLCRAAVHQLDAVMSDFAKITRRENISRQQYHADHISALSSIHRLQSESAEQRFKKQARANIDLAIIRKGQKTCGPPTPSSHTISNAGKPSQQPVPPGSPGSTTLGVRRSNEFHKQRSERNSSASNISRFQALHKANATDDTDVIFSSLDRFSPSRAPTHPSEPSIISDIETVE